MSSSAIRPGEIVVAIDHPSNDNVYFFPVDKELRSHIFPHRSGPGCPPAFTSFATIGIPGQRIHLDVKAKVGRITDALADKANADLYEQFQKKSLQTGMTDVGTFPTEEHANLTAEQVQTWLYWMRRIVDHKTKHPDGHESDKTLIGPYGRLIQGTLPELEEIVATGKAMMPIYSADHLKDNAPRFYQPAKKEEPVLAGKA